MLNRFLKARTKRNDEGTEEVKISRAMVYEAGKKTLKLLRAATPLVPVPLVTPVLNTLLALIDLCENVTALRGQVEDLKDRLHKLLGILIESGKDGSLPDETDRAIEGLSTDLESIKAQLQKVNDQKKVFRILLADDNKNAINECVKLLDASLQRFNLSHAITTKQDLHRIIQSVEDLVKRSQRMEDSFKASMQNQQPLNAPIFTSTGMPAPLTHFRGRPGLIADVGNLLCSEDPRKSRVAILATGGMGKTTVAVQVMESDIVKSKFGGNRFWVSCTGATSFSLFLQVLAVSLRIKTESVDLQADIQRTPWDTSEKNDVERVLCSLASICHVAIVLTMRSNYPPSKQNINWHVEDLKPLDIGASREIYADINPSAKDHGALDDLLNALGHMPYAVKVTATLGAESHSLPDALLRSWNDQGPRIVGNEIDRSISLSVHSSLFLSCPEALSLLKILSMLPTGATTREHLNFWAAGLGSLIPLAISTLNRTALVSKSDEPSESNPTFFDHPVVQSYMKHSGEISKQGLFDLQEAAFTFILGHKLFVENPEFKDNLKALASEDINLQGILVFAAQQRMQKKADEISDKKLLGALISFIYYQLYSKPTLNIINLAVNIARSLATKHHLAVALYCLGQIRYRLSDYDGAGDAYREARALFMSLSDPFRSAQTAFQLMTTYHFCNNMSAANALEEELRAYSKAFNADDERWLSAETQHTIALNLMKKSCYEEALVCLSDALKKFEHIDHSSDRAMCLYMLCECYGSLGQYRESMEAAQLAAQEYEYLGLDASRNYVRLLECNLLLKLKDCDQALQVSETFLQESRRLGDVVSTARALEFIAQVFEQRGDVAAVRLGYESALEQYNIIRNSALGQLGMQRCEYNLELIAQAMAEDENNKGDIASDGRRLMLQLWHGTFFRPNVS